MSDDADVFTIKEFCERHRISQAFFFEEVREGRGPRMMLVGNRGKRITREAAADWRREREEACKGVEKVAA